MNVEFDNIFIINLVSVTSTKYFWTTKIDRLPSFNLDYYTVYISDLQ